VEQPSFDELASQYVDAVRKMDGLVKRCMGLVDEGDRDSYFLHDSYTFRSGSLLEQDLVLNNPLDAVFFGTRLNLFLDKRLIDDSAAPVTGPNNERTFRPVDWTPINDWPGTLVPPEANATFQIRSSRGVYNSAPLAISHAFSTRAGSFMGALAVSAYLGGLDFHRPFPIPRGEAMTVRVSPSYTRALSADGSFPDLTSVPQYRVTAVVTGYKRVRAFR